MQTETRSVTNLDINSGLLSLAMTALRLTVSTNSDKSVKTESEVITLEEVSWHDNEKDCWVILYDRVYDVTKFLNEHPGGREVLLEHAGRDATIAFRGVGHTYALTSVLHHFLVGELPPHERIFRTPGGIRLSGISF